MSAPLALANEAFAEQAGWKQSQELIDALPYIDSLEPGEKEAVMKLINEEVRCVSFVFAPVSTSRLTSHRCRQKIAKGSLQTT